MQKHMQIKAAEKKYGQKQHNDYAELLILLTVDWGKFLSDGMELLISTIDFSLIWNFFRYSHIQD